MTRSRIGVASHRLVATALLVSLSACSTIPAYHRPEVALPSQWSNGPAGGQPGASGTASREWWKDFGSAELDTLVARGLADGFDLKIAMQRLEQARGRAEIAGALRYPNVDAVAGLSRGTASASGAKRSASVQAGVDLDPWGRNRALARSANATFDATRFGADAVRAALVQTIVDSYLSTLSLTERIRLAELIARDAQDMLSLMETRQGLGAASQLDVEQQRNALQTFQAAIPVLMQQRSQTIGDLAVLVGSPPETFDLPATGLSELQVPDVPANAPADAIARLPEVRAAEAQLKAANFDIGAARAAFLPSLSISAQLGASFNPTAALWSLAGSVLQPLFDGGQREGQLRVDRAHAEELVVAYRKAIAQALQSVEGQMAATHALREAERLDVAAVQSAQQSLRLARIQLDHGATDFLTVLVSERTLFQAEDTALQVRLQRLQATAGLFIALGTGEALPVDSAATLANATPVSAAHTTKETP
jgi:NodT family efflux transporter outer membrane factor (OMF) lipoprotein